MSAYLWMRHPKDVLNHNIVYPTPQMDMYRKGILHNAIEQLTHFQQIYVIR